VGSFLFLQYLYFCVREVESKKEEVGKDEMDFLLCKGRKGGAAGGRRWAGVHL